MRSLAVITVALGLVAGMVSARAHSVLERAEPRADSSLSSAPSQVTLWFSQRLEPVFSSITVTSASGEQVNDGKANVSGTTMSVPLHTIGPGIYRVNWRALSVDTHATEGSFSFTVGGR